MADREEDAFENASPPFATFRGPANWFRMSVPSSVTLEQTEAFLEIKPIATAADASTAKAAAESSLKATTANPSQPSVPPGSPTSATLPWSLTLYAAWVDEAEPETRAASFDPTALFPEVTRCDRQSSLAIKADNRCWAGVSRHKPVNWWAAVFHRRRTYEWRLWVIEYDAIIIVASLQSASGQPLHDDTVQTCNALLSSMEFAEKLAKPPELFRRDVLELAKKHFPLLESSSSGSFAVKIAESEVNLANFYRSYIHEPDRLKEIVLPGLATVVRLQEWSVDQLMPPLDEVSDCVMPMLYSDADADSSLDGFVRVPWVGGLCVMFVIDEEDTYRFVHQKMLDRWEIDVEELQTLAMTNLDHFTDTHPLEVTLIGDLDNPQMLVPVEPNPYNSVRLLGGQLHRRLREVLGAELVVGVPNRDFFVAVSLGHPQLVGQVKQRVLQDYQSMHHPLTSRLLVISADGVSEYCESDAP